MAGIKEIAARLSLTEATVSNALNGRVGKVSAATRQRIEETAREMGYVPHPAARALASGRSGNIGFVSQRHDNALYLALLQEIAIAVDERGGNLVTCIAGQGADRQAQEHLLNARIVDGIVALPYALPGLDRPDSPWMRRPIVFVLPTQGETRAPWVGFDDADGMAQVAAHLRALGHRRLLFLQGRGIHGGRSGIGGERYGHLREAWRASGSDNDIRIDERTGTADADGGQGAVTEALREDFPYTAVVAYNDQMALGAMKALRSAGLRVPEDVSVVGWNDVDDTPAHLEPALTTVRLSPAALAHAAVDLLYRRIAPPPAPRESTGEASPGASPVEDVPTGIRLPVHLVVRESTGAANQRGNA